MKSLPFRVSSLSRLTCVCLAAFVSLTSGNVVGAETEKPSDALTGFQLQIGDDPLTPFVPLKARTTTEQERIDALAWYGSGRLLESRNNQRGAYDAYQKAIEHDPNSVTILHALIPLAFTLNHGDDGLRYALRAVEIDTSDFDLLRRVGALLANRGDVARAIELFQRATDSPELKKDSPLYITLMRDLGLLYGATEQPEDEARCLAVVFDAMQNHEKYNLDARTRRELQADPNLDLEKLGQIFFVAKKNELAIEAFEQAAKARRVNAANLGFNVAQVYLQMDQAPKALEQLQTYFAARRTTKGLDAYKLLADILTKLDREKELVPELEKLAADDKENAPLHYFLAESYVKAERYDDAEKLFKSTLDSDPQLVGYVGMAQVYRLQNRPADLLEMLAKAYLRGEGLPGIADELESIEKDPKLVEGLIEIGTAKADSEPPTLEFPANHVLGVLAAAGENADATKKFYRHAIDTARNDKVGDLYEEFAQAMTTQDDFEGAAKVLEEAANLPALSNRRGNFLYLLSQTQELGGNTAAALESIAAALQLFPEHPLLHYQRAWIHYHAHQYDEAIPLFEKMISEFAEQKTFLRRAQFSLSNIYVQQGNIAKGEAILEDVLKEDPLDPSVNNDLGYLYADQGKNLEQAEKMITIALKAEPDNVAYLDSMGWVLFKLGKFEEALPHLEKATANSTGYDATIWDHLGDVYEKLGQKDRAIEAFKKAQVAGKAAAKPDQKLLETIAEKIKRLSE